MMQADATVDGDLATSQKASVDILSQAAVASVAAPTGGGAAAHPAVAPVPYYLRPASAAGGDAPLRTETFRSKDRSVEVTLTASAAFISYSVAKANQQPVSRSIAIDTVLGATVGTRDPSSLEVSYYPVTSASNTRTRHSIVFMLNSVEHARSWRDTIHSILTTGTATAAALPRRHILVLVNPFGGTKRAVAIWETQVRHMFVEAGITFELVITQHSGHAYQVARTCTLADYDGFCTVSGDGLIFETVNGLVGRPDWAEAVHMPLLLVPGGSGNALCFSAIRTTDPVTAAFVAARGRAKRFDCSSVHQQNMRCITTLMFTWGLIADVDFESERFRWMGATRFTVSAVQRIAALRLYKGKLSYVPAAANSARTKCTGAADCAECVAGLEPPTPFTTTAIDAWDRAAFPLDKSRGLFGLMHGQSGPPTPLLDELRAGNDAQWVHEESDSYVLVTAANATHISADSYIAPYAHWSDGCMDLIILANTSKSQLLSLFMSIEKGEHVDHVRYIKARALRVLPDTSVPTTSLMDLDGERLPVYGPVEMEVHRGLLNLVALK